MLVLIKILNFSLAPVIIDKNQIDYAINAIKQTVDKPPLILIINFVKNYLLRIFNKA